MTPRDDRGDRPRVQGGTQAMRVLITLTDLEPAVRLNAALEREGVVTELVSPMDDLRAAIRANRPDVIVLTGNLADPANVHLARQQL